MLRDKRKQDDRVPHKVLRRNPAAHKQSLEPNPDSRVAAQALGSRARDALKRSPAACLQAGFGRGTRLADVE
jgi:hypothetical protein